MTNNLDKCQMATDGEAASYHSQRYNIECAQPTEKEFDVHYAVSMKFNFPFFYRKLIFILSLFNLYFLHNIKFC